MLPLCLSQAEKRAIPLIESEESPTPAITQTSELSSFFILIDRSYAAAETVLTIV